MSTYQVRARVLKVEDRVAILGVLVEGEWTRVRARTEVPLVPMSWIVGRLVVPEDGSLVYFKLISEEKQTPSSSSSGLDLEA